MIVSVLLTVQALFTSYLMLYAWEHPDRMAETRGPQTFLPPAHRFTVLLPARHEEAVIFETIQKLTAVNYPAEQIEILVICHADDHGTIAVARRAIEELGAANAGVLSYSGDRISKPCGLNAGLRRTTFEVVTIFDAEDDHRSGHLQRRQHDDGEIGGQHRPGWRSADELRGSLVLDPQRPRVLFLAPESAAISPL